MDNSQTSSHPVLGGIYTLFSVLCGLLASITADVEIIVRCIAGLAAIVSCVFAARYHLLAAREKMQILKKNKPS